MNYYFMPRLEGLRADVTLANFPPNDGGAGWQPEQTAYVTWSDGMHWQVRKIGSVAPGQATTFSEDMLPDDVPGEVLVYLFMHPGAVPDVLDTPVIGNHMASTPSWRGNIRINSAYSAVSYQGEYPSPMLRIPTGTILSIGPMIQTGNGVQTKLLLFNMRANPALDTAELKFTRTSDLRVVKTASARFNNCTVVDLNDIDGADESLIAMSSDGITGIPLYFSHDADYAHMSFEHTHPPAELVVFGDRDSVQKIMKSRWLERAGKVEAEFR